MSIYNNFCNKLIDNLNKNENKVIVIDLILDGGAFKGTYLLGALYYLKVLQERKFIKINRVSGCSIGALLGCLFLLNKLELFEKNYSKLRECFNENCNFKNLHKIIDELINHLDKDDFKKLNDRLFVNYYNIEKKKEKLISNYKSNLELSNSLKYTSFIPYFVNGKTHYHGNIDGSKPYIFKNLNDENKKILYLSLIKIGKINEFISTNCDKNATGRAMKGIMNIHDFFLFKKKTSMCSYVNDWTLIDFTKNSGLEMIWVIIIYFLSMCIFLYKNIPVKLKNSFVISQMIRITKKFCKHILIKYICM